MGEEIARIEASGVTIRLNQKVDDLLALQAQGQFDAVLLAIGTQAGRHIDIPAKDAAHVMTAASLLHAVGGGDRPKLGRRVVVYGAGDTAMDSARTAKRLGASEAVIVFFSDEAHMEAHHFEAQEAADEGVKFQWLRSVREIAGSGVKVEIMVLDETGVPQPTGNFDLLQADTLVLALGQQAESDFLRRIPAITIDPKGAISVGADLMTGHPGIFAGGDVVAGTHTVTNATGQGKKVARHMDAWLKGQTYQVPVKNRVVTFADLHLPIYSDALAAIQAESPPAMRADFSEVAGGLSAAEARHEAKRCLSCGNCYECDICYAACPEDAIVKLGPGLGFDVSMSLCTGCSVCFEQCPCHAIDMMPEPMPDARARGADLNGARA
jgi:NADPH-dependent glutamate synthase beta subunit-like oxidoreductase